MKVRFEPRALEEFSAIVDHYVHQSADVASRFVDEFDGATSFLAENPVAPVVVEGDVRRWNLNKFPYAIYFRPRTEGILIVAIMHARRDPDAWKDNR
jgi:plasmid stabilization system protein ParE